MKLTVVLAVLIGILVLACSTVTPAPAEPTPNIDATVEARLKEEKASDPLFKHNQRRPPFHLRLSPLYQ